MNDKITRHDHAYEELTCQRELDRILSNNEIKMLRNNSMPKYDHSANSTQQPLLFNTSSVNAESLQECLSISNELHRQEQMQRRFSHPMPLEATMTHEEIYDCSFEDDRFLTALEYQNSLGSRQVTDLDASQCFGDAMKYFDEDVNVSSGVSRCDTPTKLPATGTVAAAVANFQTQLSKSMGSPPPPYKEHASPKTPKESTEKEKHSTIQELRKKYEQAALEQQHEEQKKRANEERLNELRRSAPAALPVPKQKRQKSKVKQMAHMFNSKIVQLMRRDSNSKKSYTQLDNSPTSNTNPTMHSVVLKSANKPRSRLPIYRGGLPSPVPSPRFKRRHQKHNGTAAASQSSSDSEGACLIAEDVFRKLSVKDKALLYNKFIEDMTQQHPQFHVHARFVEAHVQQELERSQREKKSPKVKEMARELEARFNLNTPKISPWAMKRLAKLQKTPEYEAATKLVSPMSPSAIEAAVLSMQENESEANHDNDASDTEIEAEELHVSTLTVVLKTSAEELLPKQRAVPRILPRKERELRFIHDMRLIERSQKRNNESMRSSISFEACGPPKKIRRTRAERLQPKAIFQNAYMERMFYNWIMEKNGVTFDITTVDNSEDSLCAAVDDANTSKSSLKSKSRVHMLLEKAIAKLESVEARVMRRDSAVRKSDKIMKIINETREQQHEPEKSVIEVQLPHANEATSSSDEVTRAAQNRAQRKVKRQAPPPPTATAPTTAPAVAAKVKRPAPEIPTQQERFSTSSSNKSEAESESGLSSLPKNTSDESQPEQAVPNAAAPAGVSFDFEFAAPNKPARKKKLRRTLTWKKDSCIVECQALTSTTDSESDHKSPAQKAVDEEQQNKTREEVANFLDTFNTPQKIKASYTLTALSTPTVESDRCTLTESDQELLRQHNIGNNKLSSPTMVQDYVEATRINAENTEFNKTFDANKKNYIDMPATEDTMQHLIDSFIDLGFETGSNDSPTPHTAPIPAPRRNKSATPLFIKLTPDLEKTLQQNRTSFSSTPVRGFQSHSQVFTSTVARQLQQQQQQQQPPQVCISPIGTLNSARRRSLQADDSRRNSLAMQVITEDRPLEQVERGQTPCSPTDTSFFGNSFNTSLNIEQLERPSKFWVRIDDFTISLDVFYNSPDRLRLLYDIFCQKSCETRDLHFGIDDHKYTVHNPKDKADISTRLPKVTGCSHYWFSTGDLAVPFNGKYLAPEKIERLFNFINDSMTDRTQLRFGIDEFEFSSVPENWASSPKFSMESSYSILVGLQGTSNGLEGRSRYAWPNSIYNSANSNTNSIKTSDLDFSEFGSEFDNSEIRLLTESPCGSNFFDMASSLDSEDMALPRQSTATRRENFFKANFEVESLDKLFEEDQKNAKNMPNDTKITQSIPEMLSKLQEQKLKLAELEKRLRTYSNHSGMAGAILPHSKESPIYMQKLRSIINAIDNIGRGGDGFKACSMKQLESFVYFLTRYADICLANCSDHMSKVLDVLLEHQQQQRDELIQSNGELGKA
ncbi:uncharacterized protein slam [Eurosta solidaginis]|uniref:uncharacterized protein slam n=1 Tax=Eurosta solidaginis TaxID=178769 RepID=UPI003530B82B